MKPISTRRIAMKVLENILIKQQNMDHALAQNIPDTLTQQEQAWIKALCFGIVRKKSILDYLLTQLSQKPLNKKNKRLYIIFYIGIYQLLFMATKSHAAVFETVELTKQHHLKYASAYVNAILQKTLREGSSLLEHVPQEHTHNHPSWLICKLKQAYPKEWQNIIQENLNHPPFFLRVNNRKTSRDAYLKTLTDYSASTVALSPLAIELLEACDPKALPHFTEGYVSVQDPAAGQAAFLLDLEDGQAVLDACAAPGGKTCHILETANVKLTAVDQDANRMPRVLENLERLNLSAETLIQDASTLDFPEAYFDRILLDAPCSGTGVIRRHPDILFLRQESDIPKLTQTQALLLRHLWPMLKPGGIFVYATCSILPEENDAVTSRFLKNTPNAQVIPLSFSSGHQTDQGWQFLPKMHGEDGFYYCKLQKTGAQ